MPTKHMIHPAMLHTRHGQDVDMTGGSIARHIISFALPLLIGNLFQQLYNTVDTWVVGNYVGDTAFSAVGTVGSITNLLIGTFTGLASGAGVVISQYYGANREQEVHDTVHTAIVLTLVLGVVFTGLGIGMIPYMLGLMKMPPDIAVEATTYLTIYFAGLMGLMVYNMGAGILRAIGDSRRPFYYLVVCAVMNTVLDLVFVLVFHMGVDGVAWATILSQGVSAVLVMITLLCTNTCVKLRLRDLRVNWKMLGKTLAMGIPAALQMALTSFSNVFVQAYINYFQGDCMGGWTAYTKMDQLLFLPMQSISLAATTFVGQNLGKNQIERAKQGIRFSLWLSIAVTAAMTIPVMVFAEPITAFFNKKAEVIAYGALFLRWLSPFYILCCVNQVYAAALRGAGNSRAPMIVMLLSYVVFRQLYLFVMARVWNDVLPIAMGYPAGWFVCSLVMAIYYKWVNLGKTRLVEDAA